MTSLLRTKSAGFDIENAVTLSKLEEDGYEKYLINTDFVFKSLPSFNADFDTKKRLLNGAKTTVSAPSDDTECMTKTVRFYALRAFQNTTDEML